MAAVLYRVFTKTTSSLGHNEWSHELRYCGYHREKAFRVYHTWNVDDFSRGPGSEARKTYVEQLTDTRHDFDEATVEIIA